MKRVNLRNPKRLPFRINLIFPLLLFLISSVYLWLLLKGEYIISFFDYSYPFNPIAEALRNLYAWNFPLFPGGAGGGGGASILLYGEAAVLYLMGLSLPLGQYIVAETYLLLSVLGIYLLTKYIIEKTTGETLTYRIYLSAFVAGLVFMIGIFTSLYIVSNTFPYIVIWAPFPLGLYLILKYVFSRSSYINKYLYANVVLLPLIVYIGTYIPTVLFWEIIISLITLGIVGIKQINYKKLLIIVAISALSLFPLYSTFFYISKSLNTGGTTQTFLGKPIFVFDILTTYQILNLHQFALAYLGLFSRLPGFVLLTFSTLGILGVLIKSKVKTKLSLFIATYLIIVALTSGLINLVSLITPKTSFIITGSIMSLQWVFSIYPLTFFLSVIVGLSVYSLFNIKRKLLSNIYVIALLILVSLVIYSNVINPPVSAFKGFNYPVVTSLTKVLEPNIELVNFLNEHTGAYNVLQLPAQWPAYYYENVGYMATGTTFGSAILPPSMEIVTGYVNQPQVWPILKYFPDVSKYNYTNYFLILSIKYIILITHPYPGPGVLLRPQYANGFPFNITGMEEVLSTQPLIKKVDNYSLFIIYEINTPVKMIYASNGIPYNFSNAPSNSTFLYYANNTLIAYRDSLVQSNKSITGVNSSTVKLWYAEIDPDHYKVWIDASKPFYLIFDQGFSSFWTLKFENGSVNEEHFLANGYANAWLMPRGNYSATIEILGVTTPLTYLKELYLGVTFTIILLDVVSYFRLKKNLSSKKSLS